MKKVLLSAALLLLATASAQAQATRTWVSGVGDDANPCSRTAPCKTFAGAISKTAAGGEISVLDPGGFGAVTITKSITINGDGTLAGILAAGTNGIVINAAATDTVIIRSVSIHGAGTGLNGIRVLAVGALHVENVTITGFTQKGISFETSVASQLLVKDTMIRNCRGANGGGIFIQPTATGSATGAADNVRLEQNTFGLRVEDRGNFTVRASELSNNDNNGAVASGVSTAAVINLESCTVTNNRNATNNASGVQSTGAAAILRITNVDIFNNNIGFNQNGGSLLVSFGNNRITQNASNTGALTPLAQQ